MDGVIAYAMEEGLRAALREEPRDALARKALADLLAESGREPEANLHRALVCGEGVFTVLDAIDELEIVVMRGATGEPWDVRAGTEARVQLAALRALLAEAERGPCMLDAGAGLLFVNAYWQEPVPVSDPETESSWDAEAGAWNYDGGELESSERCDTTEQAVLLYRAHSALAAVDNAWHGPQSSHGRRVVRLERTGETK